MAQGTPTFSYRSFKRGDTRAYGWRFTPPYIPFDWTGWVVDSAVTNATTPTSNTAAVSVRTSQPLTTIDPVTFVATYVHKLKYDESSKMTPGASYHVEAELRSTGNIDVNTPVTGTVSVEQDYVFPA